MPKRSSMYDYQDSALPARSVAEKTVDMTSVPLSNEVIHFVMSEIGRRGGLKGGRSRALKLSAKKRSAIAKMAAIARWRNA